MLTPRKIYSFLTVLVIVGLLTFNFSVTTVVKASGPYNYGEALQKALFFFEEQRSGQLPSNNRVSWMGNSGLTDGADNGVNLVGGWYDAGDHVKFGFPMASATTMLAWGLVDYRSAYTSSGLLSTGLDELKWATDYFIKAHTAPNELYIQVGDGNADHNWWGPAEVMQMARPSYKITTTCPGSDVAGETAAAMAASSIAFRPTDPTYANTLLTHAEQLYSFADTYRGKYSDCAALSTVVNPYYTSYSGYNDELVWGAAWLYKAEEAKSAGTGAAYLTKAQSYYANLSNQTGQTVKQYKWTQAWDDKSYGSYLLLAKITGTQVYKDDTQRWLNFWTVGGTALGADGSKVPYTPGGLAYLDSWGPTRYAANTAFMAMDYADYLGSTDPNYATLHTFAVNQINYILGSNPLNMSYEVGFGTNYPQNIHHRTSHGSWADSMSVPTYQRHILYGALVGPSVNDAFSDDRTVYANTEPATDYNAAFSGLLARMYQEYGGTPLASFPPADKAKDNDEIYAQASLNATGSNFTEIRGLLVNQSGWPARMGDKLSYKYFFTLDGTTTPAQITITTNYNQCGAGSVTGPTQFSGSVYYVKVDCTGTKIYPGGLSAYHAETQFRITSAGTWDTSNDWSYTGVATPSGSTPVEVVNIPVYDNGVKVFGNEPGAGGPTATPTKTLTPTITLTPTRTNTTAAGFTSTPTKTATVTQTPTKTNTPGGAFTATPTPTKTNTPGVGTCSPVTSTITAPFAQNGAGTFCWKSSSMGSYINSWGLDTGGLTINGVNFTNTYAASGSYPAQIGGFWYISYINTGVNGHWEANP